MLGRTSSLYRPRPHSLVRQVTRMEHCRSNSVSIDSPFPVLGDVHNEYCSKRHSIHAVELSQRYGKPCATCVDPSCPEQWWHDYLFWGESRSCGPAGWLAMLLIKADDVETNPGIQVWICDICHRQIQVRKQDRILVPRRHSLHEVGMLQRSAQIVTTKFLLPEMGARFRFIGKPAVAPCRLAGWLCSSQKRGTSSKILARPHKHTPVIWICDLCHKQETTLNQM